jgi:hypothetical protein
MKREREREQALESLIGHLITDHPLSHLKNVFTSLSLLDKYQWPLAS